MPRECVVVHVIDDDEAVRQSLAFLLRANAIDVQTYESGAAFLGVAPHLKSGCVITDVRMPEISGIELLRRLRELNIFLPVSVITGHGHVPLAVEALKICAPHFPHEPLPYENLPSPGRCAPHPPGPT